mgnify:CR=1 FL=1
MKKHSYITSFELIRKKVLELSIGNKVEEHLKIRTELNPAQLEDKTVFKRMCAVILSSGFNASIVKNMWDQLKTEFNDFDFTVLKDWGPEKIEILMKNEKVIRNKNKIRAIIHNAKVFNNLIHKHQGFNKFLQENKDPELLFISIRDSFYFLGSITTFDFLKRIGLNYIKPDIHVRRLFHRLGWIDSMKETNKNLSTIFKIAEYISTETGFNLNYIDGVFWLFCSGYKEVMTGPICCAIPKCTECYVKHCKYRKENNG